MIGTFGPAAARSCDAIDVTLVLIVVTAVPKQVMGLLALAHGTTSLPPQRKSRPRGLPASG